jgi:hypothetical protein
MLRPFAICFALTALSALLLPIHFLVPARSSTHVALQFIGFAIVLVTFSMGWRVARQQRAIGMSRPRYFAPSLIAFAVWILHGALTPAI